jgi:hypothetical protein
MPRNLNEIVYSRIRLQYCLFQLTIQFWGSVYFLTLLAGHCTVYSLSYLGQLVLNVLYQTQSLTTDKIGPVSDPVQNILGFS